MLAEALGVKYHVAMAHSTWTRGAVERCNKEIISMATAYMSATGRKVTSV